MGVFSFFRGHKILKVIGLIIGILISAFIILVLVTAYKSWRGGYQWQKKADNYQAEMEKPYRQDIFGGKTPEETWAMFLSALKQGDAELASKYFAVEKQVEWNRTIKNTIKAGKLSIVLNNFSSGLKREDNYLQGEQAYFYYELKNNKTEEINRNSVIFYLNPFTKVWKILVL